MPVPLIQRRERHALVSREVPRRPAAGSADRCGHRTSPPPRSTWVPRSRSTGEPTRRTRTLAPRCTARTRSARAVRETQVAAARQRDGRAGPAVTGRQVQLAVRRPRARPGARRARSRRKARSLWLNCWTTSYCGPSTSASALRPWSEAIRRTRSASPSLQVRGRSLASSGASSGRPRRRPRRPAHLPRRSPPRAPRPLR